MIKQTDSLDLIFGIHPILELLRAKKRKLLRLYTTKPEPKAFKQLQPLFPKGLQIQYVDRKKLDAIAQSNEHQGFVGYTTALPIRKQFFDAKKHPFLLLLDGIQDVRNLGAILRTAYCTNIDGVIIPSKSTAPLNGAAFKASAGLAEHVEIYYTPTAKAAAQLLEQAGYQLYVSKLEGGHNVTDITFKQPLCIVIGSEGTGVSDDLKKKGIGVWLPQKSTDISYNASVAAGIFLFMIAQQLKRI